MPKNGKRLRRTRKALAVNADAYTKAQQWPTTFTALTAQVAKVTTMNIKHDNMADLIEAPDLHAATGSGRATWDERGNSIWEWQTAPGVYSRDISAQQLRELEASNLHLLDGVEHAETTLWSRNARRTQSVSAKQATELVMPMRAARPVQSSGFDMFLKRIGLPA